MASNAMPSPAGRSRVFRLLPPAGWCLINMGKSGGGREPAGGSEGRAGRRAVSVKQHICKANTLNPDTPPPSGRPAGGLLPNSLTLSPFLLFSFCRSPPWWRSHCWSSSLHTVHHSFFQSSLSPFFLSNRLPSLSLSDPPILSRCPSSLLQSSHSLFSSPTLSTFLILSYSQYPSSSLLLSCSLPPDLFQNTFINH